MNLHFNAQHQLVFTDNEGIEHPDITPIRAFPISAPNEGISLVNSQGKEIFWLSQWQDLPEALQPVLLEALQTRDFMPVILQIREVSTFSTPSTWSVLTDRGVTQLLLKAEEDIQRLPQGELFIHDGYGMTYRIRDSKKFDRSSRRLLDRFL